MLIGANPPPRLLFRQGFEGQMTENNIEIGVVDKDGGFRRLEPAEVKDYLASVA